MFEKLARQFELEMLQRLGFSTRRWLSLSSVLSFFGVSYFGAVVENISEVQLINKENASSTAVLIWIPVFPSHK